MTGTVSRALFLLICSHAIARQVSRMPWHPVLCRAFSLYLGAGALTCSRLIKLRLPIKLRLAWGSCFIIRKRRFAYIVCIAFFNEEYLIAPVDFIVALRRTKGRRRRTLRSPSPPSSGLHLLTPGDPLRRGILAAAVYANLGFRYSVQTVCRHFDIPFGCFVFGLRSFAFQ